MASRPASPPRPEPASLSIEQMRRGIERLNRRIVELEAFDPQAVRKRRPPEVTALQNAIDEALTTAFGHATIQYRRYVGAIRLDNGPMAIAGSRSEMDQAYRARQYLTEGKEKSLILLRQAVKSLEEEIVEREQDTPMPTTHDPAPLYSPNKVFVVHGHDETALQAMARFLEQLRLEAIILREQTDQGRTIVEKFEDCASEVGFAVVLLTPDDLGGPTAATAQAFRARQNVIFELGYFAGKLGRGRSCLLRKGAVEIPSDLYGVIYTELDDADGWKLKLVREMKAAKLDVDISRILE